jgi:hypothetical protein
MIPHRVRAFYRKTSVPRTRGDDPGDEVYKDTQKQRALEAEIRKNKRIAANESASVPKPRRRSGMLSNNYEGS